MHRILSALSIALVFASSPLSAAPPATLPLQPGVQMLELEAAPDALTVGQLFATAEFPPTEEWGQAVRVIQTRRDGTSPASAWYSRGAWRGSLRTMHPGMYWLVLPPSTPPQELTLPDSVVANGGRVPARFVPATGWTITTGTSGVRVQHGPLPRSSGSYSISDTLKTRWSAGSGVAVQDVDTRGTPPWIAIDLEPFGGPAGSQTVVPLPAGGRVLVPALPEFSTPPEEESE